MTADEQSDAAYADLINTSMDQRGIDELSDGKFIFSPVLSQCFKPIVSNV